VKQKTQYIHGLHCGGGAPHRGNALHGDGKGWVIEGGQARVSGLAHGRGDEHAPATYFAIVISTVPFVDVLNTHA